MNFTENKIIAEGNASAKNQDGKKIFANKIIYLKNKGLIQTFGNSKFIDNNKTHDLAGSAQYWYGETFRIRQLYSDAATAYLDGYQNYPKSKKAPINLLKLSFLIYSELCPGLPYIIIFASFLSGCIFLHDQIPPVY